MFFFLEFCFCLGKYFIFYFLRDNYYAVAVAQYDVSRFDLYSAAVNRNIHLAQACLYSAGGIQASYEYRKSEFNDILCISAASIDDHACDAAYFACQSHDVTEVAAASITVAVKYQDITGLCCVNTLMQCKVISGIALYCYSTAYHMAFRIQRLNCSVHNALSGYRIIIISYITCGKL